MLHQNEQDYEHVTKAWQATTVLVETTGRRNPSHPPSNASLRGQTRTERETIRNHHHPQTRQKMFATTKMTTSTYCASLWTDTGTSMHKDIRWWDSKSTVGGWRFNFKIPTQIAIYEDIFLGLIKDGLVQSYQRNEGQRLARQLARHLDVLVRAILLCMTYDNQ